MIPVSEEFLPFAQAVCEELADSTIRADIDDRNETVGKKIRHGEQAWIPYLLVVGEKEKSSGRLNVRVRGGEAMSDISPHELTEAIRARTEGMPFRPLSLPRLVSKRPTFYG